VSHRPAEPLVHHELCFGCGRANLFGLLAELEPAGEGRVRGRCFVKQDHQGAPPGTAHAGILAAALAEAISLAAGSERQLHGLELSFDAPVQVGTFVELDASADAATATAEGRPVASARAVWG
jgi:acyl-coenzyme A thioesterase PaaI-like protein